MRRAWLVLGWLFVAALAVSHWSCEVPPLMAPGSEISLIANPEFIVANGGVSVITAVVTEPAGTFVPDGSVVLFFTDLGRVDPQGKTVNGVARVNLIADSRSGTATVTAVASGGAGPAPSTSTSPSPTATPGTGTSGDASTARATSAAVAAGAAQAAEGASDTVKVTIGSALPDHLIVTADPARIRGPGAATIIANVFDANGNPVANVPV